MSTSGIPNSGSQLGIIPHQQDMLTIYYLPIIDLVCLASVARTAQYTKFSTDKQLPQSSMQCGCSCMPSFSSIKWMRGIWHMDVGTFFFFCFTPHQLTFSRSASGMQRHTAGDTPHQVTPEYLLVNPFLFPCITPFSRYQRQTSSPGCIPELGKLLAKRRPHLPTPSISSSQAPTPTRPFRFETYPDTL